MYWWYTDGIHIWCDTHAFSTKLTVTRNVYTNLMPIHSKQLFKTSCYNSVPNCLFLIATVIISTSISLLRPFTKKTYKQKAPKYWAKWLKSVKIDCQPNLTLTDIHLTHGIPLRLYFLSYLWDQHTELPPLSKVELSSLFSSGLWLTPMVHMLISPSILN